jgi:pyruvate kinase
MIARGDLAVEVGFQRLAELQEEILWLTEAAYTPVVWATPVLDNFVRKGKLSRAEMSDVVLAQRAECVMLNKGDFLPEALPIVDEGTGRTSGPFVR